jgi:hypothetical protein
MSAPFEARGKQRTHRGRPGRTQGGTQVETCATESRRTLSGSGIGAVTMTPGMARGQNSAPYPGLLLVNAFGVPNTCFTLTLTLSFYS